MSKGTEIMMNAIMKGMGLDADVVMKQIGGILQLAHDTRQSMARIETQNAEILSLLRNGATMTIHADEIDRTLPSNIGD